MSGRTRGRAARLDNRGTAALPPRSEVPPLSRTSRTLRTARHSRPVQLASRLTRRWQRPPGAWPEASQYRLLQRPAAPPAEAPQARLVDDSAFRFLNETRRFEGPPSWTGAGGSPHWLRQLHSFRWLWEAPPGRAAAWVTHWLDHHPPLAVAGWEPQALSARVREWVEWLLANPELPVELQQRVVASLAHQGRVLETTLEHHEQGERLLENAIALCWLGLSLQGPSSVRWVTKGRRLLIQQLGYAMLKDGSHDARSPMIQASLAESLLRLAAVAGPSSIAQAVRESSRVAGEVFVRSLRRLTHPDGEIALLNDAALGEAPLVSALERRFAIPAPDPEDEPRDGPWSLPSAGYCGVRGRLRDGSGPLYFVFDAGPIGPDHAPGHGHADALSFELSHDGRRLFTDTGVFRYDAGEKRLRDRGTAAHGTVQVDGLDQSELYGAFGCGRRVRASGSLVSDGGTTRIAGGYYGWARKARLQHVRECVVDGSWLRFTDRIVASGAHEALLRLHVAPGLTVAESGEGMRVLDSGLPLAVVHGTGFEWSVDETVYHPEFGKELVRPCLFARTGFQDQLVLNWAIRLL